MAKLTEDTLILYLIVGTFSTLLLAAFVVTSFVKYYKSLLKSQKDLLRREIEIQQQMNNLELEMQERERGRMAADLHDSVGSVLCGAKLNLMYLGRIAELNDEGFRCYQELMQSIDESINMVRQIAWELTPEAFQHLGLSDSLATLCSKINNMPLCAEFFEMGGPPEVWQDNRALQVYRIAQELLSNALKHSGGSKITIELRWLEKLCTLIINDDGIGFSFDKVRQGVGWWNIKRRTELLKGKIQVKQTKENCKGTTIMLEVPYFATSAKENSELDWTGVQLTVGTS